MPKRRTISPLTDLNRALIAGLVTASTLFLGCGEGAQSGDPIAAQGTEEETLDLARGARGAEVERVYRYLARYGYFENPGLRDTMPDWQPIVQTEPADPAVFDEALEQGVRAFQRLSGLKESGIVDAPMRALMALPRCGHPDYDPLQQDPSQKFFHGSTRWPSFSLTYKFTNYPAEADTDAEKQNVRNAVRDGFNTWSAVSALEFTRVSSGTANINIGWYSQGGVPAGFNDFDGAGGVAGWGYAPPNGTIHFDEAETWSWTTPPGADSLDIRSILLHEGGHALGLKHSGFPSAVMYPFYNPPGGPAKRALDQDDKVGMNALYSTWVNMSNGRAATDIGIHPNGGVGQTGVVWIITNTDTLGGKTIAYWNGSAWEDIAGGAVRIAVGPHIRGNTAPFGRPWVVNSVGLTYRQMPPGPVFWQELSTTFTATDIAVNPISGVGLAIGTGSNQNKVYMYREGEGWTFYASPGGATLKRIAATSNATYVLTSAGGIMRYINGGWQTLPGPEAQDIGANWNTVWILGTDRTLPTGGSVWVFSEQPGVAGSNIPDPISNFYKANAGAGTNIAVAQDGSPWITNSSKVIFRRSRD
jgi:hypothetical protein